MIRAARQLEIMALLRKDGVVSTTDLAKRLKASPVTIRRDIESMERAGLLIRTHGGATALPAQQPEPPYYEREREHVEEKSALAKRAAEYVKDGDSIILNAGTTMRGLARELTRYRDLQVVTNGVDVATELIQSDGVQVILIGGVLRAKTLATVGPLAEESLRDIYVAKAFLGVNGISIEYGISMYSQIEAQINKFLLRSAQEVTVVVDSSKFDTPSLSRIAPITDVHRIITDSKIDPGMKQRLETAGIEIVVV